MSAIRTRFVEPRLAELAGRQHGVVSRKQLADLGLKPTAIARRVAAGRLHRIHTGVYAVGHRALGPDGRRIAAVLACGPGAALSHASAAELWGLRTSRSALIDISVPRPGGHRRPGLRIHRAPDLRPDEVATRRAIAVTTPARTILDLAETLRKAYLERLLDRNEILQLTDYPALAALARAHPGHRGAHPLLATMHDHDAGTQTPRSDLEVLFRQICHDHGLPQPRVNATIEGREVDFLFTPERLIVETDSWRYHKTRHAFEDDRARDALTTTAGYRTIRFTDRQLTTAPDAVAAAVRTTLASQIPRP